ncbi:MAG: putative sulfate exporter family transporter [Sphingomonadaceae bacterium]|nr:putative sulfate exporter family transporter [Sphingomonadaceae bacterium]
MACRQTVQPAPAPTLPAAPAPSLAVLAPGLAAVAAVTAAVLLLARWTGQPPTLMALLVGLVLNRFTGAPRLAPGLAFAARTLLRWGIVLVGARVTLSEVAALGPQTLAAVVAIIALTLSAGFVAARALGFSKAFGVLAGGAVAICGASASAALVGVLGERIRRHEFAIVLVVVALWSAIAQAAFPLLARALGFSDEQAGFMLGASVHDVAQAIGAGYAFSVAAGKVATIVKLARVAMLAPMLALVSLAFPGERSAASRVPILPWFIVGFLLTAAANSAGLVPRSMGEPVQALATGLLAAAIAAVAMRAPLKDVRSAGAKPLLAIGAASVAALALSCAAAVALYR